ncbi:Nif3-like dinuclear metal center hexameric protein [Rheinheimera baltica]|uniref:Nif3-like dinuclear metal center hexameric protein n=1 Tax=Rheinheimera baltica TaxID=67576 RepID=A0ABT9HZK8_9GAMM|nr:Nif3-like dinuclear metal center hexameric protein [Rheinheimera baltica]MDP5136368.1 Nif3-like dinuclear metal center hexameric protein [Rheinheimera baltica]MDP5144187.1 Nif3-like dinuclear metal center hexameric protein [Rheinheimera baltica]MDP5149007.1 Nif3-like dinuclear metal center hexameric protein [Rheinheimera baltica]MDP5191469.1 Nif3-like dinuclear metal center hexameric protein [Rheinheimera baltica]
MVERNILVKWLNDELQVNKIRDYCPNGLQVEGKAQINRVVTGVTASQALLDAAVAVNADAILVHHGYFWKNEAYPVIGIKKKRLQTLLNQDINLLAYHLPLDVHPVLGNNAQLGLLLHATNVCAVNDVEPNGVLMQGELTAETALDTIAKSLESGLNRQVLVHDAGIGSVKIVAWCTGGGQGYIEQAAAAGAQLFITGEVSEQTIHLSRELGIHFIAAGHHATERYGIKALGECIAGQFGLDVQFIDIDNPA